MLWFVAAVIIGVILLIALVYLPSVAFNRADVAAQVSARSVSRDADGLLRHLVDAALPLMIDAADRDLQIPARFRLRVAARRDLNRGGSAVFQAIAVVFVARLYGLPFGAGEMLAAGAAVFLASLTVASVPSAGVISLVPAFQSTGLRSPA